MPLKGIFGHNFRILIRIEFVNDQQSTIQNPKFAGPKFQQVAAMEVYLLSKPMTRGQSHN